MTPKKKTVTFYDCLLFCVCVCVSMSVYVYGDNKVN